MRKMLVLAACAAMASVSVAGVQVYGDKDVLGTGTYAYEPTTGATLEGLAAGVVTYATLITPHGFPFSPNNDFAGTDQIYVGQVQTGYHDGYSQYGGRLNGPQVIVLDYSSLVAAGQSVETLTLGIAADDFQQPRFRQPYTATVNGYQIAELTTVLNNLDQTHPKVQFFSIGIDPTILGDDHLLTLSINQGGNGGDGWAIDFLTVGVTTIPEPATLVLLAAGMWCVRRRKH
jgi:hypothetical protein